MKPSDAEIEEALQANNVTRKEFFEQTGMTPETMISECHSFETHCRGCGEKGLWPELFGYRCLNCRKGLQ